MTTADAHRPDSAPRQAFPPLPVCWPTLDPHATDEAMDALTDWIAWLVDRYRLDQRTIPACWARHGALVEELSALHTAWLTAYATTTPGDRPLTWHHEFDLARHRLTDWVAGAGCRHDEHVG